MTPRATTTEKQLELDVQEAILKEQSAWEVFQAAFRSSMEEQKAATEEYQRARQRLREAAERLATHKRQTDG